MGRAAAVGLRSVILRADPSPTSLVPNEASTADMSAATGSADGSRRPEKLLRLTLAIYDTVSDTHGADMTVGWATAGGCAATTSPRRGGGGGGGPLRSAPVRGSSMQQRQPKPPPLPSFNLT